MTDTTGHDTTEVGAGERNVTVEMQTMFGAADDARIDSCELEAARRGMTNLRQLLYGQAMQDLRAEQMAEADRRGHEYADASDGQFTECHVQV